MATVLSASVWIPVEPQHSKEAGNAEPDKPGATGVPSGLRHIVAYLRIRLDGEQPAVELATVGLVDSEELHRREDTRPGLDYWSVLPGDWHVAWSDHDSVQSINSPGRRLSADLQRHLRLVAALAPYEGSCQEAYCDAERSGAEPGARRSSHRPELRERGVLGLR